MTLAFDFFEFMTWNWLQWVFFIILIVAFFILTIGSFDLKKNDFKSTKLLFFAGYLLLFWSVIEEFIPTVSGVSPTDLERLLGFLYSLFLMSGIIYTTLHIILGIGLIKFGSKNRDPGGIVILLGGILYLVAWTINPIIVILQKYGGWYDPTLLSSITGILNILAWILYITSIIAAGVILIYSFLTKRVLFIIFGVLFFIAYLMDLLSFLGVI